MNCVGLIIPRIRIFAALAFIVGASAICRATTVATPTFSPAAGGYTGTQSVTISDTTSGATIYYTTNGTTPTSSSTRYTGAISVTTSETVEAIAEKSGDTNSAVASAAYTITVPTPTFSPAAGGYTGTQSVTISDTTSGATIYYTTNGTTPTSSSTRYTAAISVSTSETVKAIAELSGDTNSAVASAAYTITVPTPTFSPTAGTYNNTQSVTISDATSGATCYYTLTPGTTGTTPTTSSTQYSGAISVTATSVLESLCAYSGDTNSPVGSAAYTLQVASPTFSPVAGTYTSVQTVTISDSTSGATIYYTTNGSTPTTSSTQYTSPITVGTTESVKAIAAKTGYTTSSVGTAAYTINLTVATPTFSPGAGTYTRPQTVTISDSTSGAKIYYTTNGSTPTTSSTQYTSPITVGSTETVKAIGAETGYANSSVGSAAYTINLTVATPTFSPGAGTYTSPQTVTISDSTSGAKIYYTTNGSTPTTSSTRYTSPITVNSTETVKAIGTETGYTNSAVGSAAYTINLTVSTPTFSPAAGTYNSALPVTINDSTPGATLYYTTDGSTPTTSSSQYTGAITLSSTKTIKAMGTLSGYAESGVVSGTYTLPSVASTSTALSVTSGGTTVTSVSSGSVVTLTATVISGGSGVTSGTVNFCDATATYCTDIHQIGTAQLTSSGTAAITLIPGSGAHSYKAILVGNLSYLTSSSSASSLTVTGGGVTTTTISSTLGDFYPLTATVTSSTNVATAPSGTVSFVDTSNGNAVLGTGSLSGGSQSFAFTNLSSNTFPRTAFIDNQLVATGDFNGDGKTDVAVFSSSVSIFLGNGDGTFTSAPNSPISLTDSPTAIAPGDFNGDGKLDLALLGAEGNLIILLGNGDGTFSAQSSVFTDCYNPVSLEVADFNQDGKLDLAVPCTDTSSGNSYGIIILLGAGNGAFSPAAGTPVPFGDGFIRPNGAVVADFNGDGKPDLAVADGQSDEISILLGNGDGTFTEASGSPVAAGYDVFAIAVGDFNGDGHPDLAAADWYNGQVETLIGNGDGTFNPGSTLFVGRGPYSIAVGDYNQDGVPDIAVANEYDGTVTFYLSRGGRFGALEATVNANAGSQDLEGSWNFNGPFSLASADFNGDGIPDLVAVVPEPGEQSTFLILGTSLTQTSTASFSSTPLPGGGVHNVAASYGGDSNYSSSTSGTTPLAIPWITSITPASGQPQSFALISGSNFGSSSTGGTVSFNGLAAPVVGVGWFANQIEVNVPIGATTGPVTVTLNNGLNTTSNRSNSVTYTVPSYAEITAVSPIAAAVGATVTISGFGFGTVGTTVTFNGVTASPSSFGIDTIIVTVPAGATTGPIVVNGGSNSYNFTVVPGISSIAPAQGVAGTPVTITGTTFGATQGTSSVLFNGIPAAISSWSNTSIVALAPSGAGTGNVIVVVNGTSGTGPIFTSLPSIISLTPASGVIGSVVTISGSNFGPKQGISSIAFGSVMATPSQWSENTIIVPVPVGAVTGSVIAIVGGQPSNALTFTVTGSPSSSLGTISGTVTQSDGITPISRSTVNVLQGSAVVATTTTSGSGSYSLPNLTAGTYSIQGSAFGFGATQQTGVSVVANQTTTANLSLSGQSTISYAYDQLGRMVGAADPVNGAAVYSYDAVGNIQSIGRASAGQTSILNFTPVSGVVGSTVTISGTSFSTNPAQDSVSFSGVAATVTAASAGQLVVTVPSGATTGPISVTAPSGTATSSGSFAVTATAPGPSITSFSPAMTNATYGVTLTGSGFDVASNDIVSFNGSPAYVTGATSTSISTAVPASATSGPISVTTLLGTATTSTNFYVVPNAIASSQVDFTGQMTIGGSPYTGRINTGGDIGIVTFNATAGQQFSLTINGSTIASASISILSPGGGGQIASSTIGAGATILDSLSAPIAGTYTVLIASSGASYTGSVTLNLSTGSSGSAGAGTTTDGQISISIPGQTASVFFSGTAGQMASVQINNSTFPGCYSLAISILNPNGSTLTSTNMCSTASTFLSPVTLPTTGTYTLLFTPQGSGTGTANVAISLFSEQTLPVAPVSPGTTGTLVTINTPGQDAQLTFSGTAGQLASVQLLGSSFSGCYSLVLSILNPNGSNLTSANMCGAGNFFLGPVTLPTTGNYTLVIAPQNGATGSTTAALSLFSQQTGSITSGNQADVLIDIPGQSSQLTFGGSTGQSATVQLTGSTFPGCYSVTESILNPDGSTLTSGNMCGTGNFSIGPVSLPSNGTYTVVTAPQGGVTGSAGVTLTLQ